MFDTATHTDVPAVTARQSMSPVQQCAVAMMSVYTLFTAGILLLSPELRLVPLPWALWFLMAIAAAATYRLAGLTPSRKSATPGRQSRRTRKTLAAYRP